MQCFPRHTSTFQKLLKYFISLDRRAKSFVPDTLIEVPSSTTGLLCGFPAHGCMCHEGACAKALALSHMDNNEGCTHRRRRGSGCCAAAVPGRHQTLGQFVLSTPLIWGDLHPWSKIRSIKEDVEELFPVYSSSAILIPLVHLVGSSVAFLGTQALTPCKTAYKLESVKLTLVFCLQVPRVYSPMEVKPCAKLWTKTQRQTKQIVLSKVSSDVIICLLLVSQVS